MITHADIYHYKSISEAHIDFGPVNIIVGMNGVGKSNVVDALYFVRDCIVDDLETAITRRHGIESIRQWSKTKPFKISIELLFDGPLGNGRYRLSLSSGKGAFRVDDEYGEWSGPNPIRIPGGIEGNSKSKFSRARDGSYKIETDNRIISEFTKKTANVFVPSTDLLATSLADPIFGLQSTLFSGLIEEMRSFLSYSIYPNTLREPQVASREEMLLHDGSNMASVVKNINNGHRKNKDSLIEALKFVLPIASDIIVKSAGGYYVPVLRVREPSGEHHELNMSQVSDGTLRVLGILSAFYQVNTPSKIALEEPEQMVHPGVLPVIADAVKEYYDSGEYGSRQVFLTTHSPVLLDLFDPEHIKWANFKNGVTEVGYVSERQRNLIKKQLFTAGEILTSEGFF